MFASRTMQGEAQRQAEIEAMRLVPEDHNASLKVVLVDWWARLKMRCGPQEWRTGFVAEAIVAHCAKEHRSKEHCLSS